MKELLIEVRDESRVPFLLELLSHLDFVEVSAAAAPNGQARKARKKKFTPAQQAFVEELKEAVREVEMAERGEIQLQDARDFLRELKREKQQVIEKQAFAAEMAA